MTTRKHVFYGILALVSLLGLGITQSARANLITNGGFETGDFSGWTVFGTDNDVVGSNHVAQAQVLAKRIPNAEYNVLKGQSHGFFWQAPEATNEWILQWVRNHA